MGPEGNKKEVAMLKVMGLAILMVSAFGLLALAEGDDGSVPYPVDAEAIFQYLSGGCGIFVLNCWCVGELQYCRYASCIPGAFYCGCLCPECVYWVEPAGKCGDPVPVGRQQFLPI